MQPPDREPHTWPPREPALATASASGAPARSGGSAVKGGIGALLLGLLAKGKGLLLMLKALPFAKLLLTGGSMAASVLLYAINGGFAFALGLVLMIFVHEMGHGIAMKRAGIAAGWPVFVPFFGAMIAMKGRPTHPAVEAEIAYAGPLAGTAAALFCAAIGLAQHSRLFLSLAYTGFFLNLFNLTPWGFLDGGRIAGMLSPKSYFLGGAIMLGLFFLNPHPALIGILAFTGMNMFRRKSDAEKAAQEEYMSLVTPEVRLAWAVRYFGLVAFLAVASWFAHQLIQTHAA